MRTTSIAEEFGEFARQDLEPYPVFLKISEQAEAQLRRAAELFLNRQSDVADHIADPFDLEIETLADRQTRRPLQTAIRRLDILLKALEEAKDKKAEAPKPDEPSEPQEPMPNSEMPEKPQAKPQPGIPPLVQLKALREVQAELNERTAEFDQLHPDKSQLADYDLAELQDLQRSQREVAELLEQLAEQFQKPEMPEEEK